MNAATRGLFEFWSSDEGYDLSEGIDEEVGRWVQVGFASASSEVSTSGANVIILVFGSCTLWGHSSRYFLMVFMYLFYSSLVLAGSYVRWIFYKYSSVDGYLARRRLSHAQQALSLGLMGDLCYPHFIGGVRHTSPFKFLLVHQDWRILFLFTFTFLFVKSI
jgi:hypothetical protein